MALRRKISIPATVLTLLSICILVSLGLWQVRRLEEKTMLLRQLDAAYAAPQSQPLQRADIEGIDLVYGRFEGVFLADKAFLSGIKVKDGAPGHDLIVPLRTADGDVLINLGWVASGLDREALRNLTDQSVWADGLARKPSWNSFTPQNDAEGDVWYRLDIQAIARAKALDRPWPLVVYAERVSPPPGEGLPNNSRFYPNNNHLQYALFWFAMAGVLIIIYVLRFLVSPQEPH